MFIRPILLLLTLICLDANAQQPTGGGNPFNGHWQLELGKELGSSDAVLQLIGLSWLQRNVVHSLNVVEQYEVGAQTLRVVRETRYSHSDDTFALDQVQEVDDVLLGHIRQTVSMQQAQRIVTAATRQDGARYSSVRRMDANGRQFSVVMNYTTVDGRHASCTRYYNRIQTLAKVGTRGIGQTSIVATPAVRSQVRPDDAS